MGQQQILLIVLGIIVIGIAIAISTSLFSADAVSSNRDAVVSDLNNLGTTAMQHYKKPKHIGGGGNAFTGWKLPQELDTTANGNYTLTVAAQKVTIRGYGKEKASNGAKIRYTATISPTGIKVVRNN